MTADQPSPPLDAGPARSVRSVTAVCVLTGLLLVLLVATALVVNRQGEESAPPDDEHVADTDGHDHVDVDPATDEPVVDACGSAPEMCGRGAGSGGGACDDPSMCGDIAPNPDAHEIDAGTGACVGELCGDIGPGLDDGTGP